MFWLNYVLIFLCSIFFVVLGMRIPDPPVFAAVEHYPSICYLPPDSGLCPSQNVDNLSEEASDLQIRYYFDQTTQQCYPFGVQSCGGNENRFATRAECQNYCRIGV
ncbi:unnamed protein product, partial [Mesorhabditis belari]|uniref:BPTI/Kunitz inhibitor domain-containing protein n=1 Tax=Mesorhabditis belari TaxID=2138241 RepID=A0AAF3FQV0_9BILA